MSESTSTQTLVVIGASSAIAQAFIDHAIAALKGLADKAEQTDDLALNVITVSRQSELTLANLSNKITHQHFYCNYQQASIIDCVNSIGKVAGKISRIVMCNGILHSQTADVQIQAQQPSLMPEKRSGRQYF